MVLFLAIQGTWILSINDFVFDSDERKPQKIFKSDYYPDMTIVCLTKAAVWKVILRRGDSLSTKINQVE